MNNNRIHKQIFDATFKNSCSTVGIVLSNGTSLSDNYDPKRKTGIIKNKSNPIPVKALVETLSANSLIHRDLGLKEIGAKRLTVVNCDVELFKIAEKVVIDGEDYTAYNQALGNRFQIFPLKFGFSNIILFRDTQHG